MGVGIPRKADAQASWQRGQNRVTVFIWMGKKLALPFPVVKLMVAAVGSNGDGSGGSV